jgi:hypothetical protein
MTAYLQYKQKGSASILLAILLFSFLSPAQDLQEPAYPEFSEYK